MKLENGKLTNNLVKTWLSPVLSKPNEAKLSMPPFASKNPHAMTTNLPSSSQSKAIVTKPQKNANRVQGSLCGLKLYYEDSITEANSTTTNKLLELK